MARKLEINAFEMNYKSWSISSHKLLTIIRQRRDLKEALVSSSMKKREDNYEKKVNQFYSSLGLRP